MMNRFGLWFCFGIALALAYDVGSLTNRHIETADSYLVQYRGGHEADFVGPITDIDCHKLFDKLMHDEISVIREKPASGSTTDTEQLHVYCVPTIQTIPVSPSKD